MRHAANAWSEESHTVAALLARFRDHDAQVSGAVPVKGNDSWDYNSNHRWDKHGCALLAEIDFTGDMLCYDVHLTGDMLCYDVPTRTI